MENDQLFTDAAKRANNLHLFWRYMEITKTLFASTDTTASCCTQQCI